MKPRHKYNNGTGATLCIECNKVITEGLTDDLYCEEHGGEKKYKYTLTRTNDGKVIKGDVVKWIVWNENGRVDRTNPEPMVRCSLVIDPMMFGNYHWLTTPITEIIEQRDGYVNFNTENSNYILEF